LQLLLESYRWLSVHNYLFSHLFKVLEHFAFQKLYRPFLRMASSTNIFLLHFWIHEYSDLDQMEYPMGNLERIFWSSFDYCSNDCFASENGIHLRKTSLGHGISIEFTKEFTHDIFDLYSLDAYFQASHTLV